MTGFIPLDKQSPPQLALVNYFSRDLGKVPGPDFASANLISQPVSLLSFEINNFYPHSFQEQLFEHCWEMTQQSETKHFLMSGSSFLENSVM